MKNQREEPNWEPYVGREVHIEFNNGMVNGLMQNPQLEKGYVDFIPHIVYNPNGTCYLDKDTPRRISIHRVFGGDPDFLAFQEGQLIKIVKETNRKVNMRNRHIFGFSTQNTSKL